MLTQKLALSYGSRILLQFIQVAVTIVVARVAGPTVLGTIAFGLAFVKMFAFLTDIGIPTAYIKSINDGDNEIDANGTFLRIQLGLLVLFIITVLCWMFIQKYGFDYKFESKTHEYVIFISLLVITIQRSYQSIKTLFIARTEQAKQDIPSFIYSILFQALRLIVVLLGYKSLAIVFSNLIATLIILPIYLFLLKSYQFGKFNRALATKYFKISLPLIIILVAQTILVQSDRVLLQYFTDSKTVGVYTAGFKIGGFVRIIASVIGLLFFPLFIRAIAENDIQSINSKIEKFERFMFAFVFPATAFAAIYSGVIVKVILGDTYLPTIPILSVITVSMFFLTLFQPYGNIILAKGRFYQGAMIYLVQLIFFILSVIILLHPELLNKGGLGAAWAVFISNFLLGVMFIYFAKRNINEIKVFPAIKLAIYALSFSIIAYITYEKLDDNYIYKLIFAIVFFCCYWGIGYVFKIIEPNDWNMLLNIIDRKKMFNYIKYEIFKKNEN